MSKVLAIGAHPDDIEIGCAGFIQTFDSSLMVVLSSGEKGSVLDREEEVKKSASLLGADLRLCNLEDTRIDLVDATGIIESSIHTFSPDLILTMSSADVHQDHQVVHAATKIAGRDSTCTVLAYISPSSAQTFQANWFVSLSQKQMDLKIDSLNCHSSQSHRSYLTTDYIVGMARYWAMVTRSRSEYVEPYQLIKHWSK